MLIGLRISKLSSVLLQKGSFYDLNILLLLFQMNILNLKNVRQKL